MQTYKQEKEWHRNNFLVMNNIQKHMMEDAK